MNAVLDLRPIVPAAIVAVTGVVVLLAQAFTPKGGSGALVAAVARGPRRRARRPSWLLGSGRAAGAVLGGCPGGRRLRALLPGLILAVGDRDRAAVARLPARERASSAASTTRCCCSRSWACWASSRRLELVSMFVALEIMSVALYALAGLDRRDPRARSRRSSTSSPAPSPRRSSSTASRSSTASPAAPARARRAARSASASPDEPRRSRCWAPRFLLVGFGFKIASVPFHMWAPDVYEGAPDHRHRLHGRGREGGRLRRAAARASTTRLAGLASHWQPLVAVLAIVTMVARQPGRSRAAEPQAHAGLLLDRARGLPA